MKYFTILALLLFSKLFSQVNITTGSYSQNFGTTNITSWTDNTTFLGWYQTGTFRGYADITLPVTNAAFNAGGFFSYNCGSDAKIGSRASGTSPNSTIYYGVVLRNTTGLTISSINLSYTGYQMTLAENGPNINTIAFEYIVGAVAPLINAAGGTTVPALNFIQVSPNSVALGSAQLNWFPCTKSQNLSTCIPVTILNNSYILLRWKDINDAGNDHHMAIDDLNIAFDLTGNTCSIFLPIQLIDFYATKNKSQNDIVWKVAQEENIQNYILEKSDNGIDFTELMTVAANNEIQTKTYSAIDDAPFNEITYYRLKTKENNGSIQIHKIISIDENSKDWSYSHFQQANNLVLEFKNTIPKNTSVEIFDLSGKQILTSTINQTQTLINTEDISNGIYFVRLSNAYKTDHFKIIISK
jgi:hypothetical protein